VTRIYNYYKKHGYQTEVMGASFRRTAQITGLCGCDLLTIAPSLLAELADSDKDVPRVLDPASAAQLDPPAVPCHESAFRWMLNEDAMATEKLAEGIRSFASDLDELRGWIGEQLATQQVAVTS